MKEIRFMAHFGEQLLPVSISLDVGGTWWWNVLVDNYYLGNVRKVAGEWAAGHLPSASWLTAADIRIIGELIDEREREGKL